MGTEGSEDYFLFITTTDVTHASDKLKAFGIQYRRKTLASSAANWANIAEMLESGSVGGALVRVNPHICGLMVSDAYESEAHRLLSALAKIRNVFFVHQNILSGENEWEGYTPSQATDEEQWEFFTYQEYFAPPSREVRLAFQGLLEKYSLRATPYVTNAEMSVLAGNFIQETEKHLLLRVYVPSGKLWADEAARFMDLFHDWLSKTQQKRVRRLSSSTGRGTVYEFYGDSVLAKMGMSDELRRFGNFLDLCMGDKDRAEQLLERIDIKGPAAQQIIDRYARDARRLSLDLRHDRETRVISLVQNLERELLETDIDNAHISAAVEATVPPSPSNFIDAIGAAVPRLIGAGPTNLTVMQNPQFIQTVNGVVSRDITGTVSYGPQVHELLGLIKAHAGSETVELESAVHEMEDDDADRTHRVSARAKLSAFLFSLGSKLGPAVVATAQKYVESKLGL